jgi:ankyrin repeat protein
VRRGDAELLESFLCVGADPNIRDWSDRTPLMVACGLNLMQCCVVLLEYGADPAARCVVSFLASSHGVLLERA